MARRTKKRVGADSFTFADYDNNNDELAQVSGEWAAGTYGAHEIVTDANEDGIWLMSSLRQTTASPLPTLGGDPGWIIEEPGPPAFQTLTANEPVWISGNRYVLGDAVLKATALRWYAPEASGGFSYDLWRVNNNGAALQIAAGLIPTAVGWEELPYNAILLPEQILDLAIVARSLTRPNSFTANWQTKNENSNPGSGEAIFRNSATEMRISNTDNDDINQEANLNAIEIGAVLSFAGLTWTVTNITTTGSGGGGRHNFFITPNQGRPTENVYPLTWEWGTADPIPYVVAPDHWAPHVFPNNGDVLGFADTDYPPAALNDNAYGIDLLVDDYLVSPDWDFLALSRFD